ncbi:MAG: tetratricopeptide repeat protein [Erysipelotrichaceae bacterium]|nr:tetratricopeptide repeat protein [Erysipelotrichaceae bacterium]
MSMHKFIKLLSTLTLIISLVACGNDPKNTTDLDTIDTYFTITVGQETTWTPFEEEGDVTFTVEDHEILEVSSEGNTILFQGSKAGETLLHIMGKNTQSTAHITVKEVAYTATSGSVLWWVEYFESELLHLNKEQQTDYLLEVGDYMALAMPAKQFDHEFVNMAQAATLLYPNSYLINNYASLQQDMGQYEEAKRWYEKALEIDGNNPIILTNLAHTEYELGDLLKAMELAERAIQVEPNYGLAYLVMTCVHLENGDDMLAIETLFKSMRNTYTETTSDLLRELYKQVRTKANMTSSYNYDRAIAGIDNFIDMELGEMVLTDYHIELLFEAATAGVTSNGQDILSNQISLPYPADPNDAVLGPNSWEIAAEVVNNEIKLVLDEIEGYTVGNAEMEEKQAWCLAFLQTYYEYQIFKTYETLYRGISFKETGERGVDQEHEEYTLANIRYDVDDTLHKIFIDNWNTIYRAEMGTWDQIDYLADTPEEYQLMVNYYQSQVAPCDQAVVSYAMRRKAMYEESMRPLLEEYWLKMNAMLGYVENEYVRDMYGKRLIATINREAYVNHYIMRIHLGSLQVMRI